MCDNNNNENIISEENEISKKSHSQVTYKKFSKQNYYVTETEISKEYYKSIENGKPTDKLINIFMKIATRFAGVYKYVNDCDRRSCINYAVAECWQKWNTFNPEITSNLFSFYTTLISNDLRIAWNNLNRYKSTSISLDALMSSEKKS